MRAKKVVDVNNNEGTYVVKKEVFLKPLVTSLNSDGILIKCVYCFKQSETKAGNRIPVSLCWCVLRTRPPL